MSDRSTAILLCAGQGSRLLPLTLATPKCLVEVEGRAILDHQLAAVAAAGMTEAVVVGGYRIDQIAQHLAAAPPPLPVTLVFNPFWTVASSIGSVWAARDHLGGRFALMNGDTVFERTVIASVCEQANGEVALAVAPLGAPPEHDDMLVRVEHGRVVAVDKALAPTLATHRSLGLIVSAGGDAYRQALEEVIAADEGVHAFHHAVVASLAAAGLVQAIPVDGAARWQEIDRPEDIERWDGRHPQ